jgi:hypothetical protein
MDKTNMLIDEPIKDDDCEITRSGLLNIQVCSRLSEGETLIWLCQNSPAGTSGNWSFQSKGSDNYLPPVQCVDDPKRTHYIFNC